MVDAAGSGLPGWLSEAVAGLGDGGTAVRGDKLRSWGLSEVWRVTLGGSPGRSVVVKRGVGEMAGEAHRYRQLVIPLGAPAPRLLAATGGENADPVVLVLEDVGYGTLEQQPGAAGFHAAISALAGMRVTAARRLSADPSIAAGLRTADADLVETARRADAGLAAIRPDLAGCLEHPTQALVHRLARSTDEAETLVHGDFHAKNLLQAPDGRIVVIDWPGAYVHHHLGDLYCLAREADGGPGPGSGLGRAAGLFAEKTGADPGAVADRMVTGGLCWTLLALRWLAEEGVRAVPESRDWIDELVTDCQRLARTPTA